MSDERTALERSHSASEAQLTQPGYPRTIEYMEGYGNGPDEHRAFAELGIWWRAILKRKWLIMALVFVVTAGVTIEVFRTLPKYEAATVIEVGRDNSTFLKSGDLIIQNDDTLKTKLFILASEPLLEDVVAGLKLDQNPRFSRDLDFDAYNVEYRKRSYLEAVEDIFGRLVPRDVAEVPAQPTLDSTAALSESNTIRSPAESERLAPFVGIINRSLDLEALPDTRLLMVTYEHTDPAIAALVSNAIAQVFIKRSFEGRTERFTNASDWVERTTKELKQRVDEAERALATYIREHNIFSPSGRGTLTAEKLTRLHSEAMRSETDRMVKESLYEEVKQGRIAQVPVAFTDPRTTELQNKLGELATNAAQLEVNFGPENPQVLEIQQKVAAIQKQIESNRKTLEEKFKADYERAVRDEQSFNAAVDRAKTEAVQENQDAIQYSILQMGSETSKSLYRGFLEKTHPASFELAQQQNNIRIIEPARVPKKTSGPKRRQWILLGFTLSLVAGIGLALLLEYINNTIRSVDDVTRYVQLPALGVIPSVGVGTGRLQLRKGKSHLAIPGILDSTSGSTASSGNGNRSQLFAMDLRSPAAEAYRLVRTSVMLFANGGPSKTLLVTSSQPGEGKTTTCINTAISLAQLGESVLIIDCDLRTPTVHKAFDLEETPGLSTYLSSNANIDDLIRKLDLPGLSLLPCGPIPPNPADLISSAKMKDMLEMLGGRYDHILIDSPPLINLADPIILSLLVDGVVLVVRGGKSNREAVRHARQELQNVGASVLGVVLNSVDLRSKGYNYYHS